MAKRQLPKRLFKQDHVSSYKADISPKARMKRLAREHEDVLQNIEFALVRCHRDDPRVDDRVADEALGAAIRGVEPDEPHAADVFAALASIRQMREDVEDGVWRDALQVVRDSVRRHSERRPGETSYLDFVAPYVP